MNEQLQVRNLRKSFGGVHAVNDVSFDVYKGEILGLIGPNGSGKSTMVNLISGMYKQDAGEVTFEGKVISKATVPGRSRLGIGRTFQSPKPFVGLSVFESVFTIALQSMHFAQAEKRTLEILEMSDLLDVADWRSERLPIERRKWLDMARILATDPKLIMLDEVMAGLNPSEIETSIDMVRRINEMGITILFIEHVMKAVVKLCHRIVVLNEGKLLCSGEPDAVMNNPDVVKAYLGGGFKNAKAE
ncbi:ABC transporter ATP-binding protein [Oscillospiraceae bacterium MB08-C2-2]|nr:ABC transporter ATP-binding protein [Oscillospiraceae bacterium MB08-C2-2]